jgi:chemotaxis protein methyltransferase CheR
MELEKQNNYLDMSDREFKYLSSYIYNQCGINLTPDKKTMLVTRLNIRLKQLGMNEYSQYYDYLKGGSRENCEFYNLLDAVTTNKTEFFREAEHYRILTKKVLPELLSLKSVKNRNGINLWSAGCATGEEPYTLAIVLSEFFSTNSGCGFSIRATDISSKALSAAEKAIYSDESAATIPAELKYKYFLRGKGPRNGFIKVADELRKHVTFQWHNLKDSDFRFSRPIDIIFCRNVVIYFDDKTRCELFKKFYNILTPGGFLFVGHTETVSFFKEQFIYVEPSVYRKPAAAK